MIMSDMITLQDAKLASIPTSNTTILNHAQLSPIPSSAPKTKSVLMAHASASITVLTSNVPLEGTVKVVSV